jgi:hypothetical protein
MHKDRNIVFFKSLIQLNKKKTANGKIINLIYGTDVSREIEG